MNKSVLFLILFAFFNSCKNYYNETLHWMVNIPDGTTLSDVKKHQPHFVEVDWEHPEMNDGRIYFYVQNIKGSHDILNMTHKLIFENNKYQGHSSNK